MACSEVDKLTYFVWYMEVFPHKGRSLLLYLLMDEAIKVVLIIRHIPLTNYIQHFTQHSS
jgi:hypothetical protein